jgi:hypothetical protein
MSESTLTATSYPVALIISRKHGQMGEHTHPQSLEMSVEQARTYAQSEFETGQYVYIRVYEARCRSSWGPCENRPLQSHPEPHHYEKGVEI